MAAQGGWLNRLQPLLDSYHAPYKPQARYWTGFLLLVRCTLYIVFSLGGTHRSLLAIIITFTTLGFFVGFVYGGRLYKTLSVNILEALSYLNLILLSAVVQVGHYFLLVYSLVGIELVKLLLGFAWSKCTFSISSKHKTEKTNNQRSLRTCLQKLEAVNYLAAACHHTLLC